MLIGEVLVVLFIFFIMKKTKLANYTFIYLLGIESFLMIPDTYALLMDRSNSIDIDTVEDYLIAETFMGMP